MRPLKQRLQALKGGSAAKPAADADVQRLVRRIERLRTGAHRPGLPEPRVRGDDELARRLSAQVVMPGVLLWEQLIPCGTPHGTMRIGPQRIDSLQLKDSTHAEAEQWLFLDTETTGLSGGSGTIVFQVGLARFRHQKLCIKQFVISGFAGEQRMLEQLAEEISGNEILVTYNGKSFDLPLLATRYRLHEQRNPLTVLPHLDLLHPMRRRFAKSWDNCRLATVEQRLLGFRREQDLPGSQAPQAWFDYLKRGVWQPLARVLEHNRLDLLSLAVALPALEQAMNRPDLSIMAASKAAPGRRPALASARHNRDRLNHLRQILAG